MTMTTTNPTEEKIDTSRPAVIARIRKALKDRSGKAWSVTGGTGTAYGWLKIDAPPARRTWHFVDSGKRDLNGLPVYEEKQDESKPYGHMSPQEREELKTLLGILRVHHQGISIPASNDYYVEYIDRAEGRTPRKIGQPYWD